MKLYLTLLCLVSLSLFSCSGMHHQHGSCGGANTASACSCKSCQGCQECKSKKECSCEKDKKPCADSCDHAKADGTSCPMAKEKKCCDS